MVKGLDFALLNKVKSEMEKKQGTEPKGEEQLEDISAAAPASVKAQ